MLPRRADRSREALMAADPRELARIAIDVINIHLANAEAVAAWSADEAAEHYV